MKRSLATLTGLSALVAAATAHADDTSPLESLLEQRVVTAASRAPETTAEAPTLSRSISATDLRRYGVRSLDEALDFLGVGLRTQSGLGLPEVTARGVAFAGDQNNHVLLLVDGHAVNEPMFGSVQLGQGAGIPLELIDHIEVSLGPGSAVHGTNAVLAVINVVTKSASTLAGRSATLEVSPGTDGRATLVGGHSFSVLGKRTDLVAGVSYFRFDGPTLTLGPQNVGVEPSDGLPVRYHPNGPRTGVWGGRADEAYWQATPAAHVRIVRDRFELMSRFVSAKHADPGLAGDFDDPKMHTADRRFSTSLKYSFPIGRLVDASARVYFDHFDRRVDYVTSRTTSCPYGDVTCVYGELSRSHRLGVETQAAFDWLSDGSLVTIVHGSANAYSAEVTNEGHDRFTGQELAPSKATIPSQIHSVLAASVQQSLRPLAWLSGNGGLRIDRDDRFASVVTPRATLAVRPWRGATMKAIYAEAFRAPALYETHGAVGVTIRSSGLLPEHVHSSELAFEQSLGAQTLSFSAFRAVYEHSVARAQLTDMETAAAVAEGRTYVPYSPDVRLVQLRNLNDLESTGFTAAIDGAALHGKLRGGVSFTGAMTGDQARRQVTVAPRAFGNARLSYAHGGDLPALAIAATFAGKSVVDRAYDGGFSPTPYAPPQLELRATVSGPVPGIRGLSYRAIASHSFHDRMPFAIGPVKAATVEHPRPELAPVQRWSATIGLQYDF